MGQSNSSLSSLNFETFLGQGAFGFVLKAVELQSSTPMAVKFVFPLDRDKIERAKMVREFITQKIPEHVNIVQIKEVQDMALGEGDIKYIFKNLKTDERVLSIKDKYKGKARRNTTIDVLCIKLELCGENLRSWLNYYDANVPRNCHVQISIVLGILAGVRHLHRNRILHRDLKPENIMFSSDNYTLPVKIGDFGLSRVVHSAKSKTGEMTSCRGTWDYTAPEANTNDYSYQADLYSLGLILWEVVQVIPFEKRRQLFDRLVIDQELKLIVIKEERLARLGFSELIPNLTKRKTAERVQSIDEEYLSLAYFSDEVSLEELIEISAVWKDHAKYEDVQKYPEFVNHTLNLRRSIDTESIQAQTNFTQIVEELNKLRVYAVHNNEFTKSNMNKIQKKFKKQRLEIEASRRQWEESQQTLQNMRQKLDALQVRGFTSRPEGWDSMSQDERNEYNKTSRGEAHAQLGIDSINHFNFAITGATGTGKSSLVNALRGIPDNHQLAAKTGEIETTGEVKQYPLLDHPNIVLWDLPGAGTDRHPSLSYYMDQKLYAFDCLIIVTGGRFTEIEARLGQSCREFQTPVVFVRNKSDLSLDAKLNRTGINIEKAASELKKEVEKDVRPTLTKYGLADAMLFIISTRAFYNDRYFVMDEAEFVRYTINCAIEKRSGEQAVH